VTSFGLTTQQLLLFAILGGAFALLLTERIRIDLTAILIILALAISGLLTPEEALSGFSSEPAIIIAAVFVLSESLFRTGLSDRLGYWIGRVAGQGYNRILSVIMLSVAGLAAFTHHVTMTAIMLPVTLRLSQEQDISASRLLMPMSFAASLGTAITIIGAPAFLIADGVLRQAGQPGLGIFTIAPIGLAISIGGTLFMLLLGRFLLPDYRSGDDPEDRFRLDGYYTEIIVLPESSLLGRTVEEIEGNGDQPLRVVGWLQGGRPQGRPFGDKPVREGDVLLVRTTPDELAAIEDTPGVALRPVVQYKASTEKKTGGGEERETMADQLVQAVVAPTSDLIGRTIGNVNFIERYGVIVVSLWRRKGWLQTELSRVKLRAGDVLVLLGDEGTLSRLGGHHSFLMLIPFQGQPRRRHKAPLAGFIMLATILIAAFNILPITIALLAGAAAVVLTGCLSLPQAYQSIDIRIFVFIAGAIPLGLAMTETGTAELMGGWLQSMVGGWPPTAILLLLFLTAAVITQLMSDSATTALLAPVAVALATALNQPPEPYVITVAMAAVASFFTPIGHHGNLLVYGPGRYQFSDFLRVGTPLTLLVAIIVALLTQFLWAGG
jgi:di/tricarboxylate transporter